MAGLKGVSAMNGNKVELGINQITRWNTSMKFDYFFATQYKQSFIYYGADGGTTVAHKDGDVCTMSGCIATIVEGVNREDSYIWSPMPQYSVRLSVNDKVTGSVKLCGGYTGDKDIKILGEISKPEYSNQMLSSKGYYMSKVTPHCWTTSLTMPSQCHLWAEDTPSAPRLNLLSVQKCAQYVVHFYLYNSFTITDECKGVSCSFSTGSVHMNRHVKCAILEEDMFVVSNNKMAKIEHFQKLLSSSSSSTPSEIEFTVNIPHINSTPFVVQGGLFVVGGCDNDHEPFSDIYRFNGATWSLCGLSTVSRYGVSVVVFTDKNHCEAVFIAGGFKGDGIPCSVIEKVPVV